MLLLLLALGCGGEDTGYGVPEQAVPRPRVEGVVHHVSLRTAPIPRPPRYDNTLLGHEDQPDLHLPPQEWYSWQVCQGAPQRQDWLDSLVSSARRLPDDSMDWYHLWTRTCDRPEWCTWARQHILDPDTPAQARQVLQGELVGCPDALDLLQGAPAPDVITWFEQHPQGYHPLLAQALDDQVGQGLLWASRRGALLVGAYPDERAARLLVRLYQRTADPELQGYLATALHAQELPEARRVFMEWCAANAQEHNPLCSGDGGHWLSPRARLTRVASTGVGDAVRNYLLDPADMVWVQPDARSVVAHSLVQCTVAWSAGSLDQPDVAHPVERCLAALALLDRPDAVKAAQAVAPYGGDNTPLATSLVAWPALSAARERLVELGLVGELSEEPGAVEPVDIVVSTGMGVWVDGRHWSHADLARDLARLVGLHSFTFAEVPPAYDQSWEPMSDGLYWVHAWEGSWRYSAPARDVGDWLDTHQVVGLLNSLLGQRESEPRLVVVQSWTGTQAVVAGTPEALEAASSEGLLVVVPPEVPEVAPQEQVHDALRTLLGG